VCPACAPAREVASASFLELLLRRPRRFLAELGLVHRLVLRIELRLALEALRLGPGVNLAPITGVLDLLPGCLLGHAQAAQGLGHTVLLAPPAAVPLLAVLVVIVFMVLVVLFRVLLGDLLALLLALLFLAAAGCAEHQGRGETERQSSGPFAHRHLF